MLIKKVNSAKADAELAECDLTNFGNLVELLWHRVEVGNRNYENHVQSSFKCLSFIASH